MLEVGLLDPKIDHAQAHYRHDLHEPAGMCAPVWSLLERQAAK